METDPIIIKGYVQAGPEFLAYKLKKWLQPIHNERDRILHNDMLEDIQTLVGSGHSGDFILSLARLIITSSVRNVTDGQTRQKT